MQPSALTPELIAAAPEVSGRLGRILMDLAAAVAREFLRDPRHVGLIVPLWNYISRTARRFDSAITRLVAGKLRTHAPRQGGATEPAPRKNPHLRLPTQHAWLVVTLRHHAAGYGSQLNHLLSEPEAAALIAACPQAARLLRPLCHLLGISPAAIQAPPKPRRVARPSATHHSPAKAEPVDRPIHPPPHPLLAATPRKPSLPPLYPGYPPPPCEHVDWWPWAPPRSERERLD